MAWQLDTPETEEYPAPASWPAAAWLAELRELYARGECSELEYRAALAWHKLACPRADGGNGDGLDQSA